MCENDGSGSCTEKTAAGSVLNSQPVGPQPTLDSMEAMRSASLSVQSPDIPMSGDQRSPADFASAAVSNRDSATVAASQSGVLTVSANAPTRWGTVAETNAIAAALTVSQPNGIADSRPGFLSSMPMSPSRSMTGVGTGNESGGLVPQRAGRAGTAATPWVYPMRNLGSAAVPAAAAPPSGKANQKVIPIAGAISNAMIPVGAGLATALGGLNSHMQVPPQKRNCCCCCCPKEQQQVTQSTVQTIGGGIQQLGDPFRTVPTQPYTYTRSGQTPLAGSIPLHIAPPESDKERITYSR